MVKLTPGANTAIGSPNTFFLLSSADAAWDRAGVGLLPMDEKRQPTGSPALLFSEQPWNSWYESGSDVGCKLALGDLPPNTNRVLVIVYTYAAAEPVSHLKELNLTVAECAQCSIPTGGMGESALIIAEFYLRNDEWKVRALAEGSNFGLRAFGRRIGLEIDDRHPSKIGSQDGSGGQNDDGASGATGTGFAVSESHVLTCAHVVRGMRAFRMRSLAGTHDLEFVVADETNDLALLRVTGGLKLNPVEFREGVGISLGEPVLTLGYPLANLTGGSVAVTQGGIAALTGLRANSTELQFTAPIQPGSSGSPLFDMSGQVVGMVTSAVNSAQNMNFAVKACLAMAFLEAAHLSPRRSHSRPSQLAHELVRETQSSLWLIECHA